MRIRHTWNKFKCNGHHLPFYEIYAWPENNSAKGYPCPVALMQIHVHTNVWISTHLTPMIIRVCSQNLQYFYRLMDMSNTKLRLKIVFVVSQVQLRSCWCPLFCKRHLEPFVQWRVILVQVAMPCYMPPNFWNLWSLWPHVTANGVMARSGEPHSPLQVTAVPENIQNSASGPQ